MAQLDFEGHQEPEPQSERLWVRLRRMHVNGFYDTEQSAQSLLDEGWFDAEWREKVTLRAAMQAIQNCLTDRNPDGTRRCVKTDQPKQYRLSDWATCEEGIWDLRNRVRLREHDGEAIRIDSGRLIRRWPARREEILAVLPADVRPFEK